MLSYGTSLVGSLEFHIQLWKESSATYVINTLTVYAIIINYFAALPSMHTVSHSLAQSVHQVPPAT